MEVNNVHIYRYIDTYHMNQLQISYIYIYTEVYPTVYCTCIDVLFLTFISTHTCMRACIHMHTQKQASYHTHMCITMCIIVYMHNIHKFSYTKKLACQCVYTNIEICLNQSSQDLGNQNKDPFCNGNSTGPSLYELLWEFWNCCLAMQMRCDRWLWSEEGDM